MRSAFILIVLSACPLRAEENKAIEANTFMKVLVEVAKPTSPEAEEKGEKAPEASSKKKPLGPNKTGKGEGSK